MKAILAIDQSTSATKALLFQIDGRLIDSVTIKHRQYFPRPGWVEHDAEEIYRNTISALETLLDRIAASERDLVCLSITNQRETIVVFDKATGKPLHRAIVWQCRRGDPICQKLIEDGHSETVQNKTGLKIDTYFPASKLTWLFEHEPGIKQKVEDGSALIGTIETYLIYRLTSGQVFAADHTNASRTLLFDIKELRWDEGLCELFNVPIQGMPDVRESSAQFGRTNLEGLLEAEIPICGVIGDSQAALFAERCYSPGEAKVTFGTGSSVLLNIGHSMQRSVRDNVTTIGWVYDEEITYALEGIINFSGATVAWLQEQLELIQTPQETETLARALPDNEGVYLVPAFVGLSAPYWRADVKAAIVGLTPSSTKKHVARAALESIAYRIKDVLDRMVEDAGIPLQVVHADGGAARNEFLMQFVADMIRRTVRASTVVELSAQGAVFSGSLGMGIHTSLKELEKLPVAFIDYEPQMDAALAERYYQGWQQAVQRLL
jgi:glycerol kinase